MIEDRYLAALKNSIVNLEFEGVVKAAEEAVEAGVDPLKAITNGMAAGMNLVGEKFERGEYFLSELIVAGAVMKEGMEILSPHIGAETARESGKAVLATVEGDNHDIGKGIVKTLLIAHGFDVIDLGTDVVAEEIVEAVEKHEPDVLGLSALLTVTMPKMGEVVDALKARGLRDKVKVIVGGAPLTQEFAERIGADHCAINAVEGVEKCLKWMK